MIASSRLFLTIVLCAAGLASAPASAAAQATDLSAARPVLLTAWQSAERGQLSAQDVGRLAEHPLLPWLEALSLQRTLARATPAQVRTLLQRHGEQPAMAWLREAWLGELARRQDWPNFRTFYAGSATLELRCADLNARLVSGENNADWVRDAQAVWLSGRSLPSSCDAVFRALESQSQLDAPLRWQRIDLAAKELQTGLMRFLAGRLPPEQASQARDYADFIDAPSNRVASWPRDARSSEMVAIGLQRLAKRAPDQAEALLRSIHGALPLAEAQRGRVLYEIAWQTAASYLPASAQRLNAVPAGSYDERLHELRVREALHRRDDGAALQGIAAMPPTQRNDPRWQYFEARLRERTGQRETAQPLYQAAASTATFHGFLAADRLGAPYTLCALEPSKDAALRARVAAMPGLVRALELFEIDRPGFATQEWTGLLTQLSDEERHVAIELAQKAHWYDRAIFSIGSRPEDLRQYRLRFPLHHRVTLEREAKKNRLDPAWVAALTRAESAFMPMARSHADARGLMQMLPGTGAMTAKRLGISWDGPASLYQPTTSFVLGTAHLRHELDKHGGLPYLAVGAYNAGPAPVARWRQARPDFDVDFWIETVTYKETRDYIARVMAFSVIYDWRLHGNTVSLSERLVGRSVAADQRRAFHCPLTANASTP